MPNPPPPSFGHPVNPPMVDLRKRNKGASVGRIGLFVAVLIVYGSVVVGNRHSVSQLDRRYLGVMAVSPTPPASEAEAYAAKAAEVSSSPSVSSIPTGHSQDDVSLAIDEALQDAGYPDVVVTGKDSLLTIHDDVLGQPGPAQQNVYTLLRSEAHVCLAGFTDLAFEGRGALSQFGGHNRVYPTRC